MTPRGDKLPISVLVAYYATVAAFFVASFYPEYRVWGISWWAYFPLWVKFLLLIIGIAAPTVIDRLIDRTLKDRDDITATTYRWLVGGFVVVMLALFYFLRARTHFLGDGYTLLGSLGSENPLIKPRNFGGTIFQYWILKLAGGNGESDALLAYQLISYVAGLLFASVTVWCSSSLISNRLMRLLFIAALVTGGFGLLFFGYVENYSLFVVSVAAFGLVALMSLRGKVSRWLACGIAAISAFLHVFGVVLLAACTVLLIWDTPIHRKFKGLSFFLKFLLGSLLLVASVGLFAYFYSTNLFFQFSLLPIVQNRFTTDGYTLLSAEHLVDFTNLLLMLIPGLLVTAAFQFRNRARMEVSGFIFMALLSIACLATAFVFDPKLGMPRDWDLFAFCAIPLATTALLMPLSLKSTKLSLKYLFLILVLQSLLLIPRAASLTDEGVSIKHLVSYIDQNKGRSGPARFILTQYYEKNGDTSSVARLKRLWGTDLIADEMDVQSGVFLDKGRYEEAHVILTRLIDARPGTSRAWENLGRYFYATHQPDSALYCLNIALALSPYNKNILYDLGLVHYSVKDLGTAEKFFLEAYKFDSLFSPALLGLAQVYRDQNKVEVYRTFLLEVTSREQAPAPLWDQLISYYLSAGDTVNANLTALRGRGHGFRGK